MHQAQTIYRNPYIFPHDGNKGILITAQLVGVMGAHIVTLMFVPVKAYLYHKKFVKLYSPFYMR